MRAKIAEFAMTDGSMAFEAEQTDQHRAALARDLNVDTITTGRRHLGRAGVREVRTMICSANIYTSDTTTRWLIFNLPLGSSDLL